MGAVHTAACEKHAANAPDGSGAFKESVLIFHPPASRIARKQHQTHWWLSLTGGCRAFPKHSSKRIFAVIIDNVPRFDCWMGPCTVSRLLEVSGSPHWVMCYLPWVNASQHVSSNIQGPKYKKHISSCLQLCQEGSCLDFNSIACKDRIAHICMSDQGLEVYVSWSKDCVSAFCEHRWIFCLCCNHSNRPNLLNLEEGSQACFLALPYFLRPNICRRRIHKRKSKAPYLLLWVLLDMFLFPKFFP